MAFQVARVEKLLAALKDDAALHKGSHFVMRKFISFHEKGEMGLFGIQLDAETRAPRAYEPCKTAFCLAGHCNMLKMHEDADVAGQTFEEYAAEVGAYQWQRIISHHATAEVWLGLGEEQARNMFFMEGESLAGGKFLYGDNLREDFDKLDQELRINLAIRYCERLLAGRGNARWGDDEQSDWIKR